MSTCGAGQTPNADKVGQQSQVEPEHTLVLQAVQRFREVFNSPRTHQLLSPLVGAEFFDMLRAAPAEYACLTLLAHLAITFPTVSLHLVHSRGMALPKAKTELSMKLYEALYHHLGPSLASANFSECEFKGLKCPSWHGLAGKYVGAATRAIDAGLEIASANEKDSVRNVAPTVGGLRQIATAFEPMENFLRTEGFKTSLWKEEYDTMLRKMGQRRGFKVISPDFRATVQRIAQLVDALGILEQRGLSVTDNDLKSFAVRLQQELPRAWAFKYGIGKTDFLRLDDVLIEAIENSIVSGRAVAPRNAYFRKCKREGLGAARTAKRWNSKSADERRTIAPLAPGKVTTEAVKKALQRDKGPDKSGT